MDSNLIKVGKYTYYEVGEGTTTIVVLHGLMGGLSNFDAVASFLSEKNYKVLIPELPIYTQSLLKTNVNRWYQKRVALLTVYLSKQVILVRKYW